MLYQKDKNEIWLKSAVKAMEYLAISRKNNATVPPDHWALLATEQIFKNKPAKTVTVPEKLLKNHAIQICNSFRNYSPLLGTHWSKPTFRRCLREVKRSIGRKYCRKVGEFQEQLLNGYLFSKKSDSRTQKQKTQWRIFK